MSENFEKIAVPPGWTAEADLNEYIARFGIAENYFEEVKERVENERENMHQALDRGLCYFGEQPAAISAADVRDKVTILGNHLRKDAQTRARQSSPKEYVERFEGHLAYCLFAQSEYKRLAPELESPGENALLFPLTDLADHLGLAAQELEEGLKCEHYPDYDARMGKLNWW